MEEYFRSFNLFTEAEIQELTSSAKYEVIHKNDYFIREGSVCRKIAFVKSGILRSFYLSSIAEEVTYCFTFPNNLLSAYSSYISQEPTRENIQAITHTELLVIPKDKIDTLMQNHINWLRFAKEMAEQQYIELENRIFQLQMEKAEKRYADLIKQHPEYIQHIPLYYLASYLGITQRHLSRLRKQVRN